MVKVHPFFIPTQLVSDKDFSFVKRKKKKRKVQVNLFIDFSNLIIFVCLALVLVEVRLFRVRIRVLGVLLWNISLIPTDLIVTEIEPKPNLDV
jgi:hypothetical protein